MKLTVSVVTVRLNPHVETREIIDIIVKDTTVSGNVIYSKTKNYTDGVVELKRKTNIFCIDEETIDLFVRDANGVVTYNSVLPEEEEDAIFSLYNKAEVAYFK